MSQRALVFHNEQIESFEIKEEVCFDGLENFAISQYDVNNIQQVIGRDSLFIYDFNFASLNRKGRMSQWQKRRLGEIECEKGGYDSKSIRLATADILARIHRKKHHDCERMTLLSDEHFQYKRAIKWDLKSCKFEHVTISSKACRNFQNILFSVNHADLMIRQQVKAYSRETISFSKTSGAMCQKYALYMVYKNYMAPQFTKKHVRRPTAHTHSPAQILGITPRVLDFGDIFYRSSNSFEAQRLNDDWKCFWSGEIPKKHQRDLKFLRRSQHSAQV